MIPSHHSSEHSQPPQNIHAEICRMLSLPDPSFIMLLSCRANLGCTRLAHRLAERPFIAFRNVANHVCGSAASGSDMPKRRTRPPHVWIRECARAKGIRPPFILSSLGGRSIVNGPPPWGLCLVVASYQSSCRISRLVVSVVLSIYLWLCVGKLQTTPNSPQDDRPAAPLLFQRPLLFVGGELSYRRLPLLSMWDGYQSFNALILCLCIQLRGMGSN